MKGRVRRRIAPLDDSESDGDSVVIDQDDGVLAAAAVQEACEKFERLRPKKRSLELAMLLLSVATVWAIARGEWECITIHDIVLGALVGGKCVCGQTGIKIMCRMRNKLNGNTCVVGLTCLMHFPDTVVCSDIKRNWAHWKRVIENMPDIDLHITPGKAGTAAQIERDHREERFNKRFRAAVEADANAAALRIAKIKAQREEKARLDPIGADADFGETLDDYDSEGSENESGDSDISDDDSDFESDASVSNEHSAAEQSREVSSDEDMDGEVYDQEDAADPNALTAAQEVAFARETAQWEAEQATPTVAAPLPHRVPTVTTQVKAAFATGAHRTVLTPVSKPVIAKAPPKKAKVVSLPGPQARARAFQQSAIAHSMGWCVAAKQAGDDAARYETTWKRLRD
jgi:hypothetical protein